MFISTAYAQSASPGGGDFLIQLLPLVLIFVVFYFLLIRPQQKRMKEHKEMLGAVRRGDRIVTNGGLVGTVTRVDEDDDMLTVEIADGVRVKVLRSMLSDVRGKGEPISKAGNKKKNAKDDEPANDADAEKDDEDKGGAEKDSAAKS